MIRKNMLSSLKTMQGQQWDLVIIGGGATGVGAALESAARGYKTLLIEQYDFAKGTSSRSTKLVHGGVRYLQQGNVALVLDALRERGRMLRNAPHLVHNLSFVVPTYAWWGVPFYGIGLKVYDLLSGKLSFGSSKLLSPKEASEHISTLETKGLKGGILYHDGQFDDARLALNIAQTAVEQGGTVLNYMKATGFEKDEKKRIIGVKAVDQLDGQVYNIKAKAVVNATGVFVDSILQLDDAKAHNIVAPSQGIHLVFDKEFLPGNTAIMVPHTEDGRVLFAIPWYNKVVVGTTDTPIAKPATEPEAQSREIDFIMKHACLYLNKDPQLKDVRSVYVGLRPLIKHGEGTKTAALSRDHTILIAESGLITITGGKWTTYRKMGEDVINRAAIAANLPEKPSATIDMKIHGHAPNPDVSNPINSYGSDAKAIRELCKEQPDWAKQIHPRLPAIWAEVIWAVRNEMAMTLEDVLSRRTRSLLLDAKASLEAAPAVVELMAQELQWDDARVTKETESFRALAKQHCIEHYRQL